MPGMGMAYCEGRCWGSVVFYYPADCTPTQAANNVQQLTMTVSE